MSLIDREQLMILSNLNEHSLLLIVRGIHLYIVDYVVQEHTLPTECTGLVCQLGIDEVHVQMIESWQIVKKTLYLSLMDPELIRDSLH